MGQQLESDRKDAINDHDHMLTLQEDTKKLAVLIRDEKQCIKTSQENSKDFQNLRDKNRSLRASNSKLDHESSELQE